MLFGNPTKILYRNKITLQLNLDINCQKLEFVDTDRNLGVIFDYILQFIKHVIVTWCKKLP